MYIKKREESPLILASESPRRRNLLEQLGIEFEVVPTDVPETFSPGADPAEEARRIARDKASAAAELKPGNRWILAADTIVIVDDQILGKPGDEEEAAAMLGRLSGRWHKVITGWCIRRGMDGEVRVGSVESRVLIKPLTQAHIRAYVKSGEPMDKAGAYAVQGLGAFMVSRIEGSYTNVVGLPLAEVVDVLEEVKAIRLSGNGENS